jgi:hypothetical protein
MARPRRVTLLHTLATAEKPGAEGSGERIREIEAELDRRLDGSESS